MAPRIRLNIAKSLPTISEAREDTLEDTTSNTKTFENVYVSPDCSLGEEYLQSICQLAKPTYPVSPGSQQKTQDVNKAEVLPSGHRGSNLSETPKAAPRYKVTNTLLGVISLQRNVLDHVKTYSHSRTDPLEELYTDAQKTFYWRRCPDHKESVGFDYSRHRCHGTSLSRPQEKNTEKKDVISFPRLPSPRPMQRGNSCPELKSLQTQGKMPTLEHGPSQKENDPLVINGKPIWLHAARENSVSGQIVRRAQRDQKPLSAVTGPGEEQMKPFAYDQNIKREVSNREACVGLFHNSQKGTTHHWISEYQCAWKEAKLRACLLPAISES
ncbi:uncharacterized protein LOC143832363 [Paroedura picta]|uniref:uncharacterized protein LOC143832363 n=1 Tax=Paroedura picta TaxID=143630 RepID=UPI004055AAF6